MKRNFIPITFEEFLDLPLYTEYFMYGVSHIKGGAREDYKAYKFTGERILVAKNLVYKVRCKLKNIL